jgi:hypothetical protein
VLPQMLELQLSLSASKTKVTAAATNFNLLRPLAYKIVTWHEFDAMCMPLTDRNLLNIFSNPTATRHVTRYDLFTKRRQTHAIEHKPQTCVCYERTGA